MRKAELGEVADVFGGYAFKSKDFLEVGDIPVVKISNIKDGLVNSKTLNVFLPNDFFTKHENYSVRKGDILVALSGATTGKTGVYQEDSPSLLNQRVGLVRALKGKADQKYLSYFVSKITEDILDMAQGAAQPNISTKELSKFKIPLPNLEEQKAIVAKLDRAQRLIDIDKAMLAKYDQLIQSVFLDMFGDPFDGATSALKHNIRILGGYAFKSKDFVESGIPLIKIGTVNKGYFETDNFSFLPKSYLDKYDKWLIRPGDLLMSLTGTVGKDDYGNVEIASDAYDYYFLNQRVAKIEPKNDKYLPQFLHGLLSNPRTKTELTKISRGVRQANISNKDIEALCMITPSIKAQMEYLKAIKFIENELAKIESSKAKSEELFSSLVQEVFG